MGILDSLLGRKKQTIPMPICTSCGKPVTASPRKVGGVVIYEGTQCSGYWKIYCLCCHNFGIQDRNVPVVGNTSLVRCCERLEDAALAHNCT